MAADFRKIWLIGHDRALCYPDHSFGQENGAVSCNAVQEKAYESILYVIYTINNINNPDFYLGISILYIK
jgi:hypothetical protein